MKKKIYNKMLVAAALTGALAIGACTDEWDDHYKEEVQGEGTLWQALGADSELSNFKAVLDATGFETTLSSSQMFTIFAPVNSSFSAEQRDSVINLYKTQKAAGVKDKRNLAIVEFVKNHIALYNYSVANATSDSIVMMNGKYMVLKGESFAGRQFIKKNIATHNGVLFSLQNVADFLPNIYEYLARDPELDSVYDFFKNYEVDYFLASQSVPGEIKDGITHYLDSVTTLYNDMFYNLNAVIDSEDSAYWMLAPTNKVWKEQMEKIEKYFVYRNNYSLRDSLSYLMPRMHLLGGSFFNLTDNSARALQDSAMSTNAAPGQYRKECWGVDRKYYQFDKPYDEGGIFSNTVDVTCSNGVVKKADEWLVPANNTYMREIVVEAERYTASLDSVDSESTQRITSYIKVEESNPFYNQVSNHQFVAIEPTGTINTSSVWNVTNVLSNLDYDVYFVSVPAMAGDTLVAASQRVPSRFDATIYYNDLNGKEINFTKVKKLETDPTKVDTIYIGTYQFPTCTWVLPKAEVKVKIESNVTNKEVREGTHTKTLRMDCILFIPSEKKED